MVYPVLFTQFLKPDGARTAVQTFVDDSLKTKVKNIRKSGFEFHIEILTTGQVSGTISDNDGDYAFFVCDNGPEVPMNIEKMINNFDITDAIKMRILNTMEEE